MSIALWSSLLLAAAPAPAPAGEEAPASPEAMVAALRAAPADPADDAEAWDKLTAQQQRQATERHRAATDAWRRRTDFAGRQVRWTCRLYEAPAERDGVLAVVAASEEKGYLVTAHVPAEGRAALSDLRVGDRVEVAGTIVRWRLTGSPGGSLFGVDNTSFGVLLDAATVRAAPSSSAASGPASRPASAPASQPASRPANEVRLFGLSAPADAVVYVVDCSGSMRRHLDAAGKELLESVGRLSDRQEFHVVLSGPGPLLQNAPGRLVPATPEQKHGLQRFLERVQPAAAGRTDPTVALGRAFNALRRAEGDRLVFLLTDGLFRDAEQVLQTVRLNRRRQEVVLHVCLFGEAPPEAEAAARRLASETGGKCERAAGP